MGSWLSDFIGGLVRSAADWIERCLPVYEASAWNDGDGIETDNNCYNYACDFQNNTFAQLGRANGIILDWEETSCEAVTGAAIADGLTPIGYDEGFGCRDCQHPHVPEPGCG